MKVRAFVLTICLAAVAIAPTLAQQPAPTPQPQRGSLAIPPPAKGAAPVLTPPAPAAAPQPAPPRRLGQPVNVKIEFTLTDQHGGGGPTKRLVSLMVADLMSGSIRSQSDVMGVAGGVPLNIDATPELLTDGKLRLTFTVQYDWPAPLEGPEPQRRGTVIKTAMRESVSLILENGKPMVAAQSADPIGDRQVTVEVKATILR